MKTFPGTVLVRSISFFLLISWIHSKVDAAEPLLPISKSNPSSTSDQFEMPKVFVPAISTSSIDQKKTPSQNSVEESAPEEQQPVKEAILPSQENEQPIQDPKLKQASIQSSEAIWEPEEILTQPLPDQQPQRSDFLDLLNHQESFSWMAGGDDKIGMTRIGFQGEIGPEDGWDIAPFYYVSYLDGPTNTDLPARLYETGVKFQWTKMFNPRFRFHASATPAVMSDFDNDTSDSFRFIAQAMGLFIYSKETQLIFGGIYLDREDIKALPVAGLIHQFSEELKLDLVFPKPKLSWLVSEKSDESHWVYLGGEFGGGSWAIRRDDPNRSMDIVTYSDLRLVLGMDSIEVGGNTCFYEIGYVFDRKLEYESNVGNFRPDETFFIRIGNKF